MRKIVLLTIFAVLSICASAQTPIKFLGIPVDGSKAEMIEKIKAKGFEYDSAHDALMGEFNGCNVIVVVKTNNNKVYRVGVVDADIIKEDAIQEIQIKKRFNSLYHQFLNNGKYELVRGKTIPYNEDISYEMLINKKQYQAEFAPKDKSVKGVVWYQIIEVDGSYRIFIFYDNTMNQANGEDL